MGYETENRECLLDEDEPSWHDFLVLALVKSQKNLHGRFVPAAVSVRVADDPEIDILPTENLELRVMFPLVCPTAYPALLHARLDVLVCAAFHIRVGIRFLVMLPDFCCQVWRFCVHQLVLSAARPHEEEAKACIVDPVKS